MNLALPEADVIVHCAKAGVSISAIETLASGGTHLVTTTGEGAVEMRRLLAKHLIDGAVKRFAFLPRPPERRVVPDRGPYRGRD
jgi:hypothetical protein